MSSKNWLPLESNPVVMVEYLKSLGAKDGTFDISDVYGLDEDLLSMVPPTAVAVLMLFPITDTYEEAVDARDKREKEAGIPPAPESLFFMEQLVGNACGTIGLLHAIGNNVSKGGIEVIKDGFITKFIKETKGKGLSPFEIGTHLEQSDELDSLHLTAAVSGQSGLPSEELKKTDPHNKIYHFVAFVAKDGYLWELDGRRPYPRRGAACTGDGMPLLKAAAEAIQWYMQNDPENIQFSLTALINTATDVAEEAE